MHSHGLPVLATLFIWWFSTGAILYLDGLPKKTFRWSMLGASVVAALAAYGLVVTKQDVSIESAYIAFASAVLLWGWNEIGFLLGHITGPRCTPCPPDARGLARFFFASQSIIYHELLIAASALGIAALTAGGANAVGLYTFLILWLMRLSTKLNIFFGVPNITIEFLPAHLGYLKSYFRIRPMNVFFPFSATMATLLAGFLVREAVAAPPESFAAISFTLLATLAVLGVVEHWFLVVPLPFGELWSWGLASHKKPQHVAMPPDIGVLLEKTGFNREEGAQESASLVPHLAPDQGLTHQGPAKAWPRSVAYGGIVP